jgi:hypothetical protein
MRLPEIVLTTIFKKPFSTISYYTTSMIAGATEMRYEVLYDSASLKFRYPRSSIAFWYSA